MGGLLVPPCARPSCAAAVLHHPLRRPTACVSKHACRWRGRAYLGCTPAVPNSGSKGGACGGGEKVSLTGGLACKRGRGCAEYLCPHRLPHPPVCVRRFCAEHRRKSDGRHSIRVTAIDCWVEERMLLLQNVTNKSYMLYNQLFTELCDPPIPDSG